MEIWKEFLGKKVKVIFEDGQSHFVKKVGFLSEITPSHFILLNDGLPEALNIQKILRVEVLND